MTGTSESCAWATAKWPSVWRSFFFTSPHPPILRRIPHIRCPLPLHFASVRAANGRSIMYITERAVFRLVPASAKQPGGSGGGEDCALELLEVAPGISIGEPRLLLP